VSVPDCPPPPPKITWPLALKPKPPLGLERVLVTLLTGLPEAFKNDGDVGNDGGGSIASIVTKPAIDIGTDAKKNRQKHNPRTIFESSKETSLEVLLNHIRVRNASFWKEDFIF
jgi:hypothetical protein